MTIHRLSAYLAIVDGQLAHRRYGTWRYADRSYVGRDVERAINPAST